MELKEFYAAIGGNYEDTLSRFITEERIRRFALKFENDPSFENLCQSLKEGNAEEAFRAAHTLKGVCQNLGFDALYKLASGVTEILRTGSMEVEEQMVELKTCYGVVMTAVRALKESN